MWPEGGGGARRTLKHPDDACAMAVEGDVVVTGCDDGQVRLWSLSSGTLTRSFDWGRTQGRMSALALCGGLLACGGEYDGFATVWSIGGSEAERLARGEGGGEGVNALVFVGGGGRLVVGQKDGPALRVFEAGEGGG